MRLIVAAVGNRMPGWVDAAFADYARRMPRKARVELVEIRPEPRRNLLHPPHAEMKLVRCLRGRVWDVAVDLRAESPTFLHWHAEELSPDNHRMVVIPEGCAHGFQVLTPDSELLYLHTAFYAPDAEGGVRHDDPALGIRWPLPVTDLSPRDRSHPLIDAGDRGRAP